MHGTGPGAVGQDGDSFDHEAGHQSQFGLQAQHVGRHQSFGGDEDTFGGTRDRMVPERRAVDARVAEFVDFINVNDCDVRLYGGDYVDFLFGIRVLDGFPAVDFRKIAAEHARHRLEGNSV